MPLLGLVDESLLDFSVGFIVTGSHDLTHLEHVQVVAEMRRLELLLLVVKHQLSLPVCLEARFRSLLIQIFASLLLVGSRAARQQVTRGGGARLQPRVCNAAEDERLLERLTVRQCAHRMVAESVKTL